MTEQFLNCKLLAMNPQVRAPKGQVFEHTLEEYVNVTKTDEVTSLINQIRASEDKDERRRLKGMLPFRCPHYFRFRDNHRAQDAILPEEFTWQTCVDIDDVEQVEPALTRAYLLDKEEGGQWQGMLLHVEYSASRKLHLDIRIPVGMTIEEAQRAYTKALGVYFDADCCSPERMIYITDTASQLYTSPLWQTRLADDELALRRNAYQKRGLDIDGRELKGQPRANLLTISPAENESNTSLAGSNACKPANADYPKDYKGIPYEYIVEELADQLGGAPEHGNRNDFIFAMACHLRHVCNDDAQWIRQILPNYGEAQQRVDDTIASACQRNQARGMSRKMDTALNLARRRVNAESGSAKTQMLLTEPKMPDRLPTPVRLLVSKAPEMYQPAIATAIFPALGTRLSGVKMEYWDNTEMEGALMVCLLAEFSGGKSCIKKPIEVIVEQLEAEGRESRQKLKEWNAQVNSKGANKDKPQRPDDVCIQVVDSNMTNAALVKLLEDAEHAGGKVLFTRMDELEMLKQVGNGSIDHVTEIMRRAFDVDLYGQERVGSQSVTARVPLRWNFVVSSTQENAVRFFGRNIANGTFSRLNLCTIIEDKSVDFPTFGKYDDKLRSRLSPYLQMLDEAKGLVVCPQAKKLAKELALLGKEQAALTDNEVYEKLSRRAAVIAFRKSIILYLMNDRKWSKEIETFIQWSFRYDMWCKMRLFGEAMQAQMERERAVVNPGTPNMLDMLPDRFTREQLMGLRRQLGKKENPKDQLAQWVKRNYIVQDQTTSEYLKTEHYLQKHVA